MSINKITPAAVNNSLEIAPALANISFDFSLWKVEPPKEFDGVGSALSILRRDKAENGMPHVTARKLGALFGAILPSTPNLYKAYGQRASEISQVSSLGPEARKKYGAFEGQAGSDATSIWAAATSGPASIAVHLLACLLARVWDEAEAISIWVEVVQKRKEEIKSEFLQTNVQELTAIEAAKQDITRTQLAQWDASARSWLLTADAVKSRQQKQLKLIIDNVKGCVNKISETYSSVMAAWKDSMAQMEGLIDGISQQATNGEILVAISAWHLFPDMMVVKPSSKHVPQQDALFKAGGVLTVGLETQDSQAGGISWSLPLACLRFYGAPVVSSSSMSSNERSRLTLDELSQAVLGCFLASWQLRDCDVTDVIIWLSQILQILETAVQAGSENAKAIITGAAKSSWFNLILVAARHHLESTGPKRDLNRKLVMLGRRHGKNFLGKPTLLLFGLVDRGAFCYLMKSEDEQIAMLRLVAEDMQRYGDIKEHQIFIRYRHQICGTSKHVFEYATALPRVQQTRKRPWEEGERKTRIHIRWLYGGLKDPSGLPGLQRLASLRATSAYQEDLEDERWYPNGAPPHYLDLSYKDEYMSRVPESHAALNPAEIACAKQDYEDRRRIFASAGESIRLKDYEDIDDVTIVASEGGVVWPASRDSSYSRHMFTYGNIESAAIFAVASQATTLSSLVRPQGAQLQEMISQFNSQKIERENVIKYLYGHFNTGGLDLDPYWRSARAVSTVAKLYKALEHATVDIRVLQCALSNLQWVLYADVPSLDIPTPSCLLPLSLDLEATFSCITMFETGRFNVDPELLSDVMGMSFGDSIYAAAALVSDLSPISSSGEVRRLQGNVGESGLVYMVPPTAPLLKEVTISEWPNISRNTYDGKPRDCFPGTSIHLSFTGARDPISMEFSGAQDDKVFVLETLISVHDNGKWIGDLNPMEAFRSSSAMTLLPACRNEQEHSTGRGPDDEMTSIENWSELLDVPESVCSVIQTRANWQAQFAAVCISNAFKYNTILMPGRPCWKCYEKRGILSGKHIFVLN